MESRILANGIHIHYVLEGPDDAPVVTFSHALGANLHVWDEQAAACREHYRVLRYDTRGHGDTQAPTDPYTLEMLAEDVRALLQELGIARTAFAGLSMGGMIGQTLALANPELLSALLLCDTASGRGELDEAAWNASWKQRIDAILQSGLEPQVEPTIDRWFTPEFVASAGDAVESIRTMIRTTPVAGYVGCCHAISQLHLTGRLGEIGVPTLVIVGEDDPGTPVSAARTIQEGIPGARLLVVPAARHLANVEQASAVNQAMLSFLGSVTG